MIFFAGIMLLFSMIFRAGQLRGRQQAENTFATAIVSMATETAASRSLAIRAPVVENTQTPILVATDTPVATSTATSTPTPTHTHTPTNTPTFTPTSTSTPASEGKWIERYQARATEALNALTGVEFSTVRARVLLRSVAQEHGLVFVPASFLQIEADVWAAIAAPRTPNGRNHPILFWQEPNDRNQIRSQLLVPELSRLARQKNSRTGQSSDRDNGYTQLLTGLSQGMMNIDELGRFHILLAEPEESRNLLSFYIFTQSQAASDFDGVWWSLADPIWSIQAAGSEYNLSNDDDTPLPTIEITGPIISGGGDDLRIELSAPTIFIEEPPFARQQAQTNWTVARDGTGSAGKITGYRLDSGKLTATPLTTLGNILTLLQRGNINDATAYTTRLDLLQNAFDLGLGDPAQWVAVYIDAAGSELLDDSISDRLRLFDNQDRSRAYDLLFERTESENGENGVENIFRLSGIAAVEGGYSGAAVLAAAAATAASERTESEASVNSGPVANTQRVTPTSTPTPTATATSTSTPTATATEPPSAVPDISPADTGLVIGSVVTRRPSNLRSGPGINFTILAALEGGTEVEYFGVTNEENWLLLRVNDSTSDVDGIIGWMAVELVRWEDDLGVLPKFFADGTPVIPFTPTPFGQSNNRGSAAEAEIEADQAEAMPAGTPVISVPNIGLQAALPALPLPEDDELLLVVISDQIPAQPNALLSVVDEEGRSFRIDPRAATIEAWAGLFGISGTDWAAAAAELLWPDTKLYVIGTQNSSRSDVLDAERIRIIDPPQQARTRLLSLPLLEDTTANENIMALLGSQATSGLFLLERDGNLQPLTREPQYAKWLGNDPNNGMWFESDLVSGDISSFSWMRTDGTGLRINAQPYYAVQGVASDVQGNLWWIEVPQTVQGPWQLWRYDTGAARIDLYAQTSGDLFRTENNAGAATIAPYLLAVELGNTGSDAVTLLVDTFDPVRQTLHTGIFQLQFLDSAGDNGGNISAIKQPDRATLTSLLPANEYSGPLKLNSNQDRLAYFVYDAAQPSLTAGFVTPPNQLKILDLQGEKIGQSQLVYQVEDRFEFLAPAAAWRGNNRLVITRSRFAEEDNLTFDSFGLVEVTLPPPENADEAPKQSVYLLPDQQQISDFVTCLDGQYTLLILRGADGAQTLSRWNGAGQPRPLFGLPDAVDRTQICWQAATQ